MSNLSDVTGSKSNPKDEPVQKVRVSLLENLMNLAGELVLSRNQLIQGIESADMKAIELSGQRIDLITSELQEYIMKTRMDKIDALFDGFIENIEGLGKNITISVEGKDVELDKSVLEGIETPLRNLLENIVEYGIEEMEQRSAAGKNPIGQVTIKAFQDAGQINITMSHDGKEENGNIVTRNIISMIEEIGGIIEVDRGKSVFVEYQIKLPLTLAIIPSQITAVGDEKYAIPQANLSELIRIPANEVRNRIETVGDAEVVRIRGELLPVLNLPVILGIERTWENEEGKIQLERRKSLSDKRSEKYKENGILVLEDVEKSENFKKRGPEDRRKDDRKPLNIAVVHGGNFKYGLLIDELHDSEEIVVKPLGRHLKKYKNFAGATIMGDGKVALILDILNIAQSQKLATKDESKKLVKNIEMDMEGKVKESLVLFKNLEKEYFAAPFTSVERIERIPSSTIEIVSNRKVVQYRGGALPLFELSDIINVDPMPPREQVEVIVFEICDRQFGLIVTPPVDTVDIDVVLDESTLKQFGVKGSMIINKHTTLLLDIVEMAELFQKNYGV